ncbi:MAG TPA: PAS domain S-box protein [Sphingobacteriaceae bacterium]
MTNVKNLSDYDPKTNTLETALYKTPDPIVVFETKALNITYANEAFLDMVGDQQDIVGKPLSEILPEADNKILLNNLANVLETGKTLADAQEVLHIRRNGKPATLKMTYTASAIGHQADGDAGALVIFKKAGTADNPSTPAPSGSRLTETEHRLEVALQAGSLGFYELDHQTGKVECTTQFKSIFGFHGETTITKADLMDRILPHYHGYLEGLINESIRNLSNYHSLYQICLPDGSVRWIRGSGYARHDDAGRVILVGVVNDITSIKTIEEKQAVLAAIIDSSDDAIISKTLQGYITSWNRAAERMYEYTEEEAVGSHISMLIPESLLEEENEILARVSAGLLVDHFETVRIAKSGRRIPVSLTVSPVRDSNGNIIGASKIARDISKDHYAEEKQAILAAIVNSSNDAIISKDLRGTIMSWNQGAERVFGYTAEEAIGKSITMLIPASRLSEEDHILSKIRSGQQIEQFETVRVRKDGREIPITLSVSPIKDRKNRIIGASKIARDISEQKRFQEKQAMLAAIVNSSDDAIISKTLDGIITSWNLAAERLFGYTAAEAIGRHISLLIPPERIAEEEYIISSIAQGKKVHHFETTRLSKDGTKIPLSLTVSPIQDEEGRVIGASKIARDISERKQSEKALERYARNLEIINSMAKTISEKLNIQQILQKVIEATVHLVGAESGVFFYKTYDQEGEPRIVSSSSGRIRLPIDEHRLTDPAFNSTQIIRVENLCSSTVETIMGTDAAELESKPVSYLEVPLFSKAGQVCGYLVFGHTEPGRFTNEHENLIVGISLQAAAALENARLYEEVSSLNAKKDEFIGMASHELKTPLTSMTGYLQILERQQKDELSRNFVRKTIEKAGKLIALVSDLLDISKIEAGKLQLNKEPFDVRPLVDEAIELIQLSTTTHRIILDTDVECFLIEGDKQRVEQVIVNLLTNAIKYSPASDAVYVYLQKTDSGIRIGVRDTGIGIPREKLGNIFSRFYRVEGLSPHMSGLGIGLYITREIVERHHGKIWVESTEGSGSTFWFSLPIISE